MPSDSPSSQCGLGVKSKAGFSPQVLTTGCRLRICRGHFVAGQVGNAGQRLAQPVVEVAARLVQLVELVFEGAGLVHHGGRVLPGLLQRADLLAQLVAAGLEALGGGDGLAAALIEGAKIAQQRSRVGPARAQFLFNKFQVARTNPKSSIALSVYCGDRNLEAHSASERRKFIRTLGVIRKRAWNGSMILPIFRLQPCCLRLRS
jgi:hypothetical protein